MTSLLGQLVGGDRRSIGKSDLVVQQVIADRARLADIFGGFTDDDPLIRMRCADVAEKVTKLRPEWLQPYKRQILAVVSHSAEQEVRWHVAQMLPRLRLTPTERHKAATILFGYLEDKSRIVKTFALQALTDLAHDDPDLRRRVLPLLRNACRTGSPAVRARAKKLIEALARK